MQLHEQLNILVIYLSGEENVLALINLVPFDLTRRPGRPTQTVKNRGAQPTSATERVKGVPEQRPVVNKSESSDRRRRIERRHNYKPIKNEKRKSDRRAEDLVSANAQLPEDELQNKSIDFKV